jgi:hypothetical protein
VIPNRPRALPRRHRLQPAEAFAPLLASNAVSGGKLRHLVTFWTHPTSKMRMSKNLTQVLVLSTKRADCPRLTTGSIQSGRRDSNPRHSAWEADALPTELRPQEIRWCIETILWHCVGQGNSFGSPVGDGKCSSTCQGVQAVTGRNRWQDFDWLKGAIESSLRFLASLDGPHSGVGTGG